MRPGPGTGLGTAGANEIVISTGRNVSAISLMDVNRDGSLDFVVANYRQPPQILINEHTGRFRDEGRERIDQNWAMPAVTLEAADLNQDGAPDLAMGGYSNTPERETTKMLALFANDGQGRFRDTGFDLPGARRAVLEIRAADLDRVAGPDLIVTTRNFNDPVPSLTSEIYLNRGNFSFEKVYPVEGAVTGLPPRMVILKAVDLDGNGYPELYGRESGGAVMYDNRTAAAGRLSFEKMTEPFGGSEAAVMGRAEFASLGPDGLPDLVAEQVAAGELTEAFFLRGMYGSGSSGSGSEAKSWSYFSQSSNSSPLFKKERGLFAAYLAAVGDLDGDGKADLVAAGKEKGRAVFYQGAGDGTFSGRVIGSDNPSPRSLWLADINMDARTDVIILNGGAGIKIFMNDGKLLSLQSSEKKWYRQKWVKYAGIAILAGGAWYLYQQSRKKKRGQDRTREGRGDRAGGRRAAERSAERGGNAAPPIAERRESEAAPASSK